MVVAAEVWAVVVAARHRVPVVVVQVAALMIDCCRIVRACYSQSLLFAALLLDLYLNYAFEDTD